MKHFVTGVWAFGYECLSWLLADKLLFLSVGISKSPCGGWRRFWWPPTLPWRALKTIPVCSFCQTRSTRSTTCTHARPNTSACVAALFWPLSSVSSSYFRLQYHFSLDTQHSITFLPPRPCFPCRYARLVGCSPPVDTSAPVQNLCEIWHLLSRFAGESALRPLTRGGQGWLCVVLRILSQ